jgi:Zn-dependent protease
MESSTLYTIATWLVPLAFAIVFHEVAHGYVAYIFGDNTAKNEGRLTLDPIKHVDPVGTVVLPTLLAIAKAPVFGWAKPVPVNPNNLRDPRWHMVLVAAAGPASNVFLAVITMIFIAVSGIMVVEDGAVTDSVTLFFQDNLENFFMINLFLAVFNMIPLPPFDGSKVLAGFLPRDMAETFQSWDRYALPIMLGLFLVIPTLMPNLRLVESLILPPVSWLASAIITLVNAIFG